MAEAMAPPTSKEETYTSYNNSGYGNMQQDWQGHWNWGAESDYTSDQFCGNVAFFLPFQGNGMASGSSMTAGTGTQEAGAENQSLQEIVQKIATLQAENQRLMHLCEVERQMRQIQVTAFQQTLEMYAVPRSEVDQLVRRFQEDGSTANYGGMNQQFGMYSNATTATGSGTGSAVSLETLLQDLHKKLYPKEKEQTQDEKELWGSKKESWPEANSSEVEEVEQYLCHLESMVEMTVDERARTTLLNLTPEQGKMVLSKVEEIISEQGGFCRSLSSMVQSVCRKTGHAAKQ